MAKSLLSIVRGFMSRGYKPERSFDDYADVERTIGFDRLRYQVRKLVDAMDVWDDVTDQQIVYFMLDVFFDSGFL